MLEVRLNDDLSLTLFDTEAVKSLLSVPKKGLSEEKHQALKTKLSTMKKEVRQIYTNRRALLKKQFLSGEAVPAGTWKNAYIANPVLNRIARMVVWQQSNVFFTLSSIGAIQADGAAYTVMEKSIRVGHPIDMTTGERNTWQNYFMAHNIKQPFEQVWEPVVLEADRAKLSERYVGRQVSLGFLYGFEDIGKLSYEKDGSGQIYIDFGGISLNAVIDESEYIGRFYSLGRHMSSDTVELGLLNITSKCSIRLRNHVFYRLDKGIFKKRLLEDDIAIAAYLPNYTPMQLQEFILLSAEHNCVKCTALLLDYKNKNYSNVEFPDEFTLV